MATTAAPLSVDVRPPLDRAVPARGPERSVVEIEEGAVLQTLHDYGQAYAEMNVLATARVWPSVDRRALARAFATLKSQGLTFESCKVSVVESGATVHCRGSVQFVRKVGNPVPLTAQQEWLFRMRKFGNEWVIEEVAASRSSASAQAPGQS